MECVLSPRLRTSNNPCQGRILRVSGLDARSCGFSNEVFVCSWHLQQKKQVKTCCYPLQSKGSCSDGLVPCPQRLFAVFDNINLTQMGTHICTLHLNEADKNAEITSHESYCPPNPRKVR